MLSIVELGYILNWYVRTRRVLNYGSVTSFFGSPSHPSMTLCSLDDEISHCKSYLIWHTFYFQTFQRRQAADIATHVWRTYTWVVLRAAWTGKEKGPGINSLVSQKGTNDSPYIGRTPQSNTPVTISIKFPLKRPQTLCIHSITLGVFFLLVNSAGRLLLMDAISEIQMPSMNPDGCCDNCDPVRLIPIVSVRKSWKW